MYQKILTGVFALALFAFTGCGSVQEASKTLWGSSTRALENARTDAARQDFSCSLDQGFDAVIALVNRQKEIARKIAEETRRPSDPKAAAMIENTDELVLTPLTSLEVFSKDRRKHQLVLMGIPGTLDTTEVGVFLTEKANGICQVEIASLSKPARLKAAEIVFSDLKKNFPVPEPKPKPAPVETPAP